MNLSKLIPESILARHAFSDWGDEEFQVQDGQLAISFSGHYDQRGVEYKLEILAEANKLFKKYSKFSLQAEIDGRKVTTELRFKFDGTKVYRAIVWEKDSDRLTGEMPGSQFIYTIFETDNLWDLREIAQLYDPKYNPKSLCY